MKAEIKAASITTANDQRDTHLRSPDFFDVENHPLITFASRAIEQRGDDLVVTGALTIHGVAKDVMLTVENLGSATGQPARRV